MKITANYITKGYLEKRFINQLKQDFMNNQIDTKVAPILSLKHTERENTYYYLSFVSMRSFDSNLYELQMPLFTTNSKQIAQHGRHKIWQKYQALVNSNSSFMNDLCDVLRVNSVHIISIRENTDEIKRPEFSQIIINPM